MEDGGKCTRVWYVDMLSNPNISINLFKYMNKCVCLWWWSSNIMLLLWMHRLQTCLHLRPYVNCKFPDSYRPHSSHHSQNPFRSISVILLTDEQMHWQHNFIIHHLHNKRRWSFDYYDTALSCIRHFKHKCFTTLPGNSLMNNALLFVSLKITWQNHIVHHSKMCAVRRY